MTFALLLALLPVRGMETLAADHPRLYCTPEDLPRLRALRTQGGHALIWRNLEESAQWCLARKPRAEWIAPAEPDPIYENLYDRFYAIMGDLAITEHLAFAYALSGEPEYGEAARQWVLASCRVWQKEAEGKPDGGKAYAVCRLLKGVAVGYDLVFDRFTEEERREIRDTLTAIADLYYREYFTDPFHSGPEFSTHHAIVEFGSFGVTALALLGEVPQAREWLDATIAKFERHLLPNGLAEDGAQIEGATFWASTMHYRLFFMDALRRVTGRDLFREYARFMNADLARASIATQKQPGWSEPHQTVVLSPSYGQLDYYAPVLLFLAREYRRPLDQYLAGWDHSLGHLQQTRYITPHRREPLLFELGGYAYLWYDPSVPAEPDQAPRAYHFPSVRQAYLRASWQPDDLLVAVHDGQLVVHAGGLPILIALNAWETAPSQMTVQDDGSLGAIAATDGEHTRIRVELQRPDRLTIRLYGLSAPYRFWSLRSPDREGNLLSWKGRAQLRVTHGQISAFSPEGYTPDHAVGNGKLTLFDPEPHTYPTVSVQPMEEGEIVIAVER